MPDSIKFLRMHAKAKLPTRGSIHAAGLDLYSVEDVTIQPSTYLPVRTGLSVEIPLGFYGRVAPRSGLAVKHGVDVLAGVIDSDYRGEIICVLINNGESPFFIEEGSRIAQLIVEAIAILEPVWAEELDETRRGKEGFGSTGCS